MEVMILSFIGASLKSRWNLSSTQESLITTAVFAGMLIGAYLWGVISDMYGRRQVLYPFVLFFVHLGHWSLFLSQIEEPGWLSLRNHRGFSWMAFAALLFYGPTPESKRYLCINGQTAEALNIMRRVAAVNQKELPAGILVPESRNVLHEEFGRHVDSGYLSLSAKKVVSSNSGFSTLLILVSYKLRRISFLPWMFFGNGYFIILWNYIYCWRRS